MTDEQQQYIFDGEEKSELKLNITNFDGPLDLLLELVKQNKIEIKDIFVSQVTEQFLQYIEQISDLDVDKAGEYMAMAATLLEIKAKQLIPVLAEKDDDEDSPEKVLIRQLEEYKVFKEVVADLKECENVDRFYREPDKSVGKAVTVVKDNLSVEGFMQAFSKFLMKMQLNSQVENVSRTMQRETFSVAQKVRMLLEILKTENSFLFSQLFDENTGINEYITTFLAVLELLKQQVINVKQKQLFDDIAIEKRPDSEGIEVVVEDEYESIE
ncbi:MAG: segregation and condensation protein A [Candidatus Fimimonas sp.]